MIYEQQWKYEIYKSQAFCSLSCFKRIDINKREILDSNYYYKENKEVIFIFC